MTMTMPRTRARTDRFTLRGWTYAYHELRDQGLMACLVPESEEPRVITLWSKQQVEIRKGDVALIYPQIGWPVPPGVQPAPTTNNPTDALNRAAEKVEAFKAAAAAPSPPMSSADDLVRKDVVIDAEVMPDMSPKLLAYHRDGESLHAFVSRLTPELEREFNDVTQFQLYGAGNATLDAMRVNVERPCPEWAGNLTTVSERHGEISALLAELQRLGADAETGG